MRTLSLITTSFLLAVTACAEEARDKGGGDGAEGGAEQGASSNGDNGGSGGGSGSDGATPTGGGPLDDGVEPDGGDDGLRLDVGFETEGAGVDGGGQGCDKVDFLFVIDASGSMGDEQAALVNSFPKFINSIQTTLDQAQDYHIMVTSSSSGWCKEICDLACPLFSGIPCGAPFCGDYIQCSNDLACDDRLGVGNRIGKQAGLLGLPMDVPCDFASNKRFIDSSEPNIAEAFTCAASVGTDRGGETMMGAALAALEEPAEVKGCNLDFLRDDAILVLTVISDENDETRGSAQEWYDRVVAAKNGDDQATVFLGIFGDNDLDPHICPDYDPSCDPQMNPGCVTDGAEAAPKLRELVGLFGNRGFYGNVCLDDYEPFFQDAVDLIDTACTDFVPPG